MKTSKIYFTFISLITCFTLPAVAATTDELIERINTNQSRNSDYMLTVDEIEQLETSNDPVAHYFLGLVYAEGDTPNTPRDQCKAADHMQISAKGGYPYAQLYLGYANLWGLGLRQWPHNALAWFGQAQKTLIAADLKELKDPIRPYNYGAPENTLEQSLVCYVNLQKQLNIDDAEALSEPNDNVYGKPCIASNVINTLPLDRMMTPERARELMRERLERREPDEPDLGYWCSPKLKRGLN